MNKKKLLIINVTANSGSTGRIAEQIGMAATGRGFEPYFAYGRKNNNSRTKAFRIGSDREMWMHGLKSRLFDMHALGSAKATKRFIDEIRKIKPDIIHIHNLHGYYANIRIFLEFLASSKIPVVWTLHDCWNFTGHCAFFDRVNCNRWKTLCHDCPAKKGYPVSLWLDRSRQNFLLKKKLFTALDNVTFVTPSQWLCSLAKESFLGKFPVQVINNGVDLSVFRPCPDADVKKSLGIAENEKVILGVANVWHARKGLDDILGLASAFPNAKVVLVGVTAKQNTQLPEGVIGITRTENTEQLARIYSMADVYVNPTYSDNFPTTNIEALSCGTPVVTYETGGSPESIDENTGIVVEKGDKDVLECAIKTLLDSDREVLRQACRRRAEELYNKEDRFRDYIELYDTILTNG